MSAEPTRSNIEQSWTGLLLTSVGDWTSSSGGHGRGVVLGLLQAAGLQRLEELWLADLSHESFRPPDNLDARAWEFGRLGAIAEALASDQSMLFVVGGVDADQWPDFAARDGARMIALCQLAAVHLPFMHAPAWVALAGDETDLEAAAVHRHELRNQLRAACVELRRLDRLQAVDAHLRLCVHDPGRRELALGDGGASSRSADLWYPEDGGAFNVSARSLAMGNRLLGFVGHVLLTDSPEGRPWRERLQAAVNQFQLAEFQMTGEAPARETIHGLVRYSIAGRPNHGLLCPVPIAAQIDEVYFGRDVQEFRGDVARILQVQLEEPSFSMAARIELVEPSLVKTAAALFHVDDTLAQAARSVCELREVAKRTQIAVPGLEEDAALVLGQITPDDLLFCPSHLGPEIILAADGGRCRRVIGPMVPAPRTLRDVSATLQVYPARDVYELWRIVLGTPDPLGLMHTALERLALVDPTTKGREAEWWQQTERRLARSLDDLTAWLEDPMQQPTLRSRIIQSAIAAVASLVDFQTGKARARSHALATQLEQEGHWLTAIWLLVHRSFLLRERREEAAADECLRRAKAVQERLPFDAYLPELLHQLGRSLYYKGRFRQALQLHWQGYELLDSTMRNNLIGAKFCQAAGKCFNDVYQHALALELCRQAAQIYGRIDDAWGLAGTYGAVAETYWRIGELDRAEQLYRGDLERSRQGERSHAERHWEMRAANYVANVLFAKGQLDEALQLFEATDAYYRKRLVAGHTAELGNLVYSTEGRARVAAAREQWQVVKDIVNQDFAHASEHMSSKDDPACLPVGLLAYLNAIRLKREGDGRGAQSWLLRSETLLELYPAEQAMVRLEAMDPDRATDRDSTTLEAARRQLFEFLDNTPEPDAFGSFRERLINGDGILGAEGAAFYAREQQVRSDLQAHFIAARRELAQGNAVETTRALRAIQRFVVFFRDLQDTGVVP